LKEERACEREREREREKERDGEGDGKRKGERDENKANAAAEATQWRIDPPKLVPCQPAECAGTRARRVSSKQ